MSEALRVCSLQHTLSIVTTTVIYMYSSKPQAAPVFIQQLSYDILMHGVAAIVQFSNDISFALCCK